MRILRITRFLHTRSISRFLFEFDGAYFDGAHAAKLGIYYSNTVADETEFDRHRLMSHGTERCLTAFAISLCTRKIRDGIYNRRVTRYPLWGR